MINKHNDINRYIANNHFNINIIKNNFKIDIVLISKYIYINI